MQRKLHGDITLYFLGSGNSAKVDPREIKNRGALLQKYLDHQAEFELQALFALQALVHKLEHPPGEQSIYVRLKLLPGIQYHKTCFTKKSLLNMYSV